MESDGELRDLRSQWNYWMICAAMAVSFLGTFTTTQVMIQARTSATFFTVLTWITIASVAFGFCSSWSLHFVAMLACEFDLPIGLDVGLTVLTAALAVTFTFAGLGIDLLLESYKGLGRPSLRVAWQDVDTEFDADNENSHGSGVPLLAAALEADHQAMVLDSSHLTSDFSRSTLRERTSDTGKSSMLTTDYDSDLLPDPTTSPASKSISTPCQYNETTMQNYIEPSSSLMLVPSRRASYSSEEFHHFKDPTFPSIVHDENAFIATYRGLCIGFNKKHVWRGLVWSLSLWCMHYGGLLAMRIPKGYITFNVFYIILTEIISWVVCIVGSIFMEHIEPFLTQQVLFSGVATLGIASMHFTGMQSATFHSYQPPSNVRGYPPQLPIAIVAIAITTCMLSHLLLAHFATMSRNKMAEVMWTRRRLWRTIAQKETAEAAAAARSTFIASASHEIRTPLHHLQGYTDLLSQKELGDDSRALLHSIQLATRTLALITNNVLDWSKLESDTDAMCRSVAVDIRSVCEAIFMLLPHHEHDDTRVESLLVVAPDVPETILLDETYIHRILMNLLSNSLKFTRSGYIMLSIEVEGDTLIATVRDSGVGIPSTFLPRLFDPFTQAQTRGTQRGTGLGLNIVKKLLSKMGGTIRVKSQYGAEPSGSIFTIEIPIEAHQPERRKSKKTTEIPTVALLDRAGGRTLEGLKLSWELSGYNVLVVKSHHDLQDENFKYVWATSEFLEDDPECLQYLVDHQEWLVLVPYTDQSALRRLPGLLSSPNLIPITRPLIWHTFDEKAAVLTAAPPENNSNSPSKSNGYAPAALLERGRNNLNSGKPGPSKTFKVLLVEDNSINLKLGKKMLTSLGYSVLVARDGEEGIEQVLAHDETISVILMDQSMPGKDGITATQEIRELEAIGRLQKRHCIIACTAVVDTNSRALFRAAGADTFLAKPLSLALLDQTLKQFCT